MFSKNFVSLMKFRASYFLFYCIPLLLIVACTPNRSTINDANEPQETETQLRKQHKGPPESLHIIRNPLGVVNLVIGEFETNLTSGDVAESERLKNAALAFLSQNSGLWDLKESELSDYVVLHGVQLTSDSMTSVFGYQIWRGLPIKDSEVSVTFSKNGDLLAVVGRFYNYKEYSSNENFDLGMAVRAALSLDGEGVTLNYERMRSEDGRNYIAVRGPYPGLPMKAERLADPQRSAVLWRLLNSEKRWLVDEISGDLIRAESVVELQTDSIVNRNLRVANINPGSDDWQNHYTNLPNDVELETPVRKEDFGDVCRYYLQSGLGQGDDNALWPQTDDNSPGDLPFTTGPSYACTMSETNDKDCPFSFRCARDYGNGSYFRQQHYYHYLERGLSILRETAFHKIVPISTWDVQLVVDEPFNPNACTTSDDLPADACFNRGAFDEFRTITLVEAMMDLDNIGIQTLWHELGHYMIWAYGKLGYNCFDGDESLALKETLADVISALLAKREFSLRYEDAIFPLNGMGNLAPYHIDETSLETFQNGMSGCAAGMYSMGTAFAHAIWEIAFGVNCDFRTPQATQFAFSCFEGLTNVSDGKGPGDLSWADVDQATGTLLYSIAFALKLSGPATTFRQFAELMLLGIRMQPPGNNLSRELLAREILGHHGLATRPMADLVVSLTHTPEEPVVWETVTFQAEVRNVGTGVARISSVNLRIPRDDFSGVNRMIPALLPGQSFVVERSAVFFRPQTFTYDATADCNLEVNEGPNNEWNNSSSETVVIGDFTVNPPSKLPIIVP